jgi:ABC-type nitrate/sulfonate/bicarbonate transport system substrate-binding protein
LTLLAHAPLREPRHEQNRRDVNKMLQVHKSASSRKKLRLGFVPLTDCAPLVMAHELGLFRKHGLQVSLSRELGWATIRDKIIHGELEAAHAVAGMPVAATLGLGSVPSECLTALILSLHGNAITLSNELWRNGVRDGASLKEEIRRNRGIRTLTFGIVHPFSSHNHLLRNWLVANGIYPDQDVRLVVVPPPQMVVNLKAGHLDGFCVGEPWNSAAIQSRSGWAVAVSAELDPGHPEKVLMVRNSFAAQRASEHLALVAALIEACEYCSLPANHERIISTLAHPHYVGAPAAILERGIRGPFDFGQGNVRPVSDFCIFHGGGANEPSGEKAGWVLSNIRASGLCRDAATLNFALGRRIFRSDIYEQALQLRNSHTPENEIQTQSQSHHVLA